MSLTSVSWQLINTPSATAASIADKTNAINTVGKYEGLMVWDITNKRLMRASGSADVSDWDCVAGTPSITPT